MSRGKSNGKSRASNPQRPTSPLGRVERMSKGQLPDARARKVLKTKETSQTPAVPKISLGNTQMPVNQQPYIAGDHANNTGQLKAVGQYDFQQIFSAEDGIPSDLVGFRKAISKIMAAYALQGNWRVDFGTVNLVAVGLATEITVSADVGTQANADQIQQELERAASYFLSTYRPKVLGRLSQFVKPYKFE